MKKAYYGQVTNSDGLGVPAERWSHGFVELEQSVRSRGAERESRRETQSNYWAPLGKEDAADETELVVVL